MHYFIGSFRFETVLAYVKIEKCDTLCRPGKQIPLPRRRIADLLNISNNTLFTNNTRKYEMRVIQIKHKNYSLQI